MKEISLKPIEDRVVVLPDSIEETTGGGLIVKADFTKTQDRRTQTRGVLVATSDCAFSDFKGGKRPQIGDRIVFAIYSGEFYTEGDVEYKIMNDEDIVGILKEQV